MVIKDMLELGKLIDMLSKKGVYRFVSPELSIDISPKMLYTSEQSLKPTKKGAKASQEPKQDSEESYEYGEEQV